MRRCDFLHCVKVERHVTRDASSVRRVRVALVTCVLVEARVGARVAVDGTVALLAKLKQDTNDEAGEEPYMCK